jgi:NhaA family Na+:H+ antiporter
MECRVTKPTDARSPASGVALIATSALALALANSPFADAYQAVLDLPVGLSAGRLAIAHTVAEWIDNGLMALFFLLVGLEIRREMTQGQLATLPRAAAPIVAALGGMIVPAAIYAALNWHDPASLRGWAIPIATDIAFSLAVLGVLGRRVPTGLKVFLTALAVMDDLGAIVIIASFYAEALDPLALAASAAVLAALFGLNRAGVRALGPYMVGFVLLWVGFAHSGIHPTLAGVAVAFAVPMQDRDGDAPARRLEHALTGWVAYVVLPLFGLANAGLHFDALSWRSLHDPIVPGIVLGLFVGKPLGVFGATFIARRTGLVRLPRELSLPLLYGASVLCGIGFTMSLFIGDLAFPAGLRAAELRAAVFAASLASALLGLAVLAVATRRGRKAASVPVAALPWDP